MRRLFTLVAASMLLSTPSFAAKDVCKGVKVKKDAFGSARVAEAGDLKLKFVDGKWVLTLGINAGGGYGGFAANRLENLPEGTDVEVMLADDTRIALQTSASVGPQLINIMGISVTHYDLPFSLEPEIVRSLVNQPITAYRIVKAGDTWAQSETKKGDAKKFTEMGTCMLGT
jgi:hypothetical protein